MNTVIGIDLGTQSLKVLFYDAERRAVAATGTAPLGLHRADGGVAEQHAEWWVNALREAMLRVDAEVRQSARSVAVSGQQHGFVALDKTDRVLSPVKLWCDTSTEKQCADISEDFGGFGACIREVGNPILAGYTASKVRWLKDARPQDYEKLDGILLPHDYLNLVLTGERCMEMGDASGTGFLDIRKRTWSADMLRAIDPDRDLAECLPLPRSNNEAIGTVRRDIADELGIPAGIPVAIGGGDNMMGAIGTGNVRPGNMTMSLGTSGTVYAHADEPIIDADGEIAAFCSSTGGWLPLLCTMNCTVATELMRGLLGADLPDFERQIGSAPRGSAGILTLPFFNGERTPALPEARGCIVGLDSINVKPENLLRSAVEGATFALKSGIDKLGTLGVAAEDVVVTGGGSKSPAWRQLVADICNLPVTVYRQDEGAAFGAALQALQAIEPGAAITDVVDAHLARDEARCCEPSPAAVSDYADAYRGYRAAVEAITPLYSNASQEKRQK